VTTRGDASFITKVQYNERGLVQAITDPLGNETLYEYDPYSIEKQKNIAHIPIKVLVQGGYEGPPISPQYTRSKDPKTVKKITRFHTRRVGGATDKIETLFYRTGQDLCSNQNLPPSQLNRITRKVNNGEEKTIREYCFDTYGNLVQVKKQRWQAHPIPISISIFQASINNAGE